MNSQVNPVKKVFVGMSGGVDSSVSATLLKKAGYDVTGVYIKVWQPDWIECNWREEKRDAMRAAAHIGIPFVELNLEKEYKQGVIDYMIAEYRAGRTPNPDVMCNREVKFGGFWKWARENGADHIATGHYARVEELEGSGAGAYSLLKGVDTNKDQSYFLWTLNQNDLPHVLFPVGHLNKPDVRALAKKFGLPNAEKKDSQGLCFIGKIDVKEFLAHYIKTEKGNVLNEKGEVIGTHSGALFLTLGERHGFTITKKSPHDDAYYVVSKDAEANTITVSNRNSENGGALKETEVSLEKVNWTRRVPSVGESLMVQTRYRQPFIQATIKSVSNDKASLLIKNSGDPITPGQSLVIYDGQECLGGGIIV